MDQKYAKLLQMERLWPKGEGIPIFQFYQAENIEDMLSSRQEVVTYSLERILETHKRTGELSFMVHSDILFNRFLFVLASYLPDILLDRNKKCSLYRLTGAYIYLPLVHHRKEVDGKARGLVLADGSGSVVASLPDRFLLKKFEEKGWLNGKTLKENDWQSAVVLNCNYTSSGDKYTLVQVFNRWATEHQREATQQFVQSLTSLTV